MHLTVADWRAGEFVRRLSRRFHQESEHRTPEFGIHATKEQGSQWDGRAREGEHKQSRGCCMFERIFFWKKFLPCRNAELKL
jgi:hypothetical protein